MRFARLVIISIALLFVIATLIGVLLPSHVLVSRAVNINNSRDAILPYLKDINQWKAWVEGMNEPAVFVSSPLTAALGNTDVRITSVTDTTVVSEWKPKKGSPQTATFHLIGDVNSRVTVVQWQFEQTLKWYPWERLGSMMNDKILGTMMEKNLAHLKATLEK